MNKRLAPDRNRKLFERIVMWLGIELFRFHVTVCASKGRGWGGGGVIGTNDDIILCRSNSVMMLMGVNVYAQDDNSVSEMYTLCPFTFVSISLCVQQMHKMSQMECLPVRIRDSM